MDLMKQINLLDTESVSPSSTNGSPLAHRYGFKCKHLGLVLEESCGQEVFKDIQICPIPLTNNWFEGVFNLRGSLIPVFDLKLLLFDEKTLGKLFIVIDSGKDTIALRLDYYPELLTEIFPSDCEIGKLENIAVPHSIENYILQIFQHQSDYWLEFDKHSFFTSHSKNINRAS